MGAGSASIGLAVPFGGTGRCCWRGGAASPEVVSINAYNVYYVKYMVLDAGTQPSSLAEERRGLLRRACVPQCAGVTCKDSVAITTTPADAGARRSESS